MRTLKNELLSIYNEMKSSSIDIEGVGTGLIHLADFGNRLIARGIDYKIEGYEKLKLFIEANNDLFSLYVDKTKKLPVYYIKVKEQNDGQNTRDKIVTLYNWAYLGHYPTMIKDLAEFAMYENWDFGQQQSQDYSILSGYLNQTFLKIRDEKKIYYSYDRQYAVFNTGLADKLYRPIYALFIKNRNYDKQPWYLLGYCVEGEDRNGKILIDKFRKLPERAHYFNTISDLLYDVNQGEPVLDHKHILIERIARYPYSVLKEVAPTNFSMIRPEELSENEKKDFFERLAKAIELDQSCYNIFKSRVEHAVSLAVQRIKWNYKSAIPMYYPRKKAMCLLLPLCIKDVNKVDVALVVSKGESGRYQGETIYPLNWAYRNARLVCRPDSDWLVAEKIQRTIDE